MNNQELVTALKSAVRREREATAYVLSLLREVDERRLFLERGFSSLYSFCRGELGYSEPEAMLRIQALRLCQKVPEVAEKIEQGEITLSVVSQIQTAVRREELGGGAARALVEELSGASKREAEVKLAEKFPTEERKEKARPISEERVEIRFSVSKEEFELIQELMNRRAHSNFERKYEVLFVQLAREKLNAVKHRPDKVKIEKRSTTRHIPAQTRRAVWKRDEGRCQFTDPITQRRCYERHGLQLDHIHPYAAGGSHTPENLRLLCGAHNRHRNSG